MKNNPKERSNTILEKIRGSTKEGYEAIDSMKERIVVLKPLSTITELSLQWLPMYWYPLGVFLNR